MTVHKLNVSIFTPRGGVASIKREGRQWNTISNIMRANGKKKKGEHGHENVELNHKVASLFICVIKYFGLLSKYVGLTPP